ncbi:DDE-type integrase/transposase/recombinase [Amycolatopsis sp. K13G38]|uniref:DDE-type integrase/transposase/recombinase n=1 Tax=Amycolatopsis acididurans TaxID=2724524 RepID=A0ABX1JME5_9PSEU|nr:DDE-type integrase/transposase/recombinase [Amycolatopsis acididurans]
MSRKTVTALMRRAGLTGLPLRRKAKRVPSTKTVTDLVKRNFHRDRPNQLWVTDITEHPTREGKLYCCVVLDAYSRRVIGWAIDSRQRADLATSALGRQRRRLPLNRLIVVLFLVRDTPPSCYLPAVSGHCWYICSA